MIGRNYKKGKISLIRCQAFCVSNSKESVHAVKTLINKGLSYIT